MLTHRLTQIKPANLHLLTAHIYILFIPFPGVRMSRLKGLKSCWHSLSALRVGLRSSLGTSKSLQPLASSPDKSSLSN